ncbi:MAG: alpha/beta fold hydrolase [Thermoguttaceae bacterium]
MTIATTNATIVQAFYDNLSRGDMPAATKVFAHDLTWVESPFPGQHGGTFHGKDNILTNVLGVFIATWAELSVTPEGINDVGEFVIVHGHYRGKHKWTGRPFEARFVHTWTLLDGKAVRFEMLADSAQFFRTVRPDSGLIAVSNRSVRIDGLDIFYREAGPKDAPTILLLHGFPTSSHMFRNLIPALADQYHVVAPDYPGYGQSSAPPVEKFDYTFDNFAEVVEKFTEQVGLRKYTLYVQDYGAPVGYRLAVKHPERVTGLVVQNGNAYDEGLDNDFWKSLKAYWQDRSVKNAEPLRGFLKLEATKWQYTHGVRNVEAISPDTWTIDQALLDRPGNQEVQLALFYSYGSNPAQYPRWHEYFRQHQPPTLIVWGKNDTIFPAEGAHPYKRDLKNIEFHLLDTGHFALEEEGQQIASLMRDFMRENVGNK